MVQLTSGALSNLVLFDTIRFALMLFKLIGLLADVRFTGYQMVKQSFAILTVKLIIFFITESIIQLLLDFILNFSTSTHVPVALVLY